jgi:hypothetical protein
MLQFCLLGTTFVALPTNVTPWGWLNWAQCVMPRGVAQSLRTMVSSFGINNANWQLSFFSPFYIFLIFNFF